MTFVRMFSYIQSLAILVGFIQCIRCVFVLVDISSINPLSIERGPVIWIGSFHHLMSTYITSYVPGRQIIAILSVQIALIFFTLAAQAMQNNPS